MSQRNTKPWLKKGWTKLLEKREQQFVAWFTDKYGREPDHRDVEKRWDDFELYEVEQQMSKGGR